MYGQPGNGAAKIATVVGNADRTVIFGYENNAALPAFPNTAPAPSCGFLLALE